MNEFVKILITCIVVSTNISLRAENLCHDYEVGEVRSFHFLGRGIQDENIVDSLTSVHVNHEVKMLAPKSYELRFLLDLSEWGPTAIDLARRITSCTELAESYLQDKDGNVFSMNVFFKELDKKRTTEEERQIFHDEFSNQSHLTKAVSTRIRKLAPGSREHSLGYTQRIKCPTVIHELLHLTGLVDEYKETQRNYGCRTLGPRNSLMHNQHHAFTSALDFPAIQQVWTCMRPSTECPEDQTYKITLGSSFDGQASFQETKCVKKTLLNTPPTNLCNNGKVPVLKTGKQGALTFSEEPTRQNELSEQIRNRGFFKFGERRDSVNDSLSLTDEDDFIYSDLDPMSQLDLMRTGHISYNLEITENQRSYIVHDLLGFEFNKRYNLVGYNTIKLIEQPEHSDKLLFPAHSRQILFPNCKERNLNYLSCAPNAYRSFSRLKNQCLEVLPICETESDWLN